MREEMQRSAGEEREEKGISPQSSILNMQIEKIKQY